MQKGGDMHIKRAYAYPGAFDNAVKAAKVLGIVTLTIEARGTWRSLHQVDGDYLDFEGPFALKRGIGPVFVRDDGTEVFMVNDTSMVQVTFGVGEA